MPEWLREVVRGRWRAARCARGRASRRSPWRRGSWLRAVRVALTLVMALSAVSGTGPAGARATPAQHLPPLSAAFRAHANDADRLADTSLEVIRLGQAAARAGKSYTEVLRALRTGRAQASRLRTALIRGRHRTAELRRLAGAIAGAQYRTGSRLPFAQRTPPARNPESVLRDYRAAERRQQLLAARTRDAIRTSRSLAVDSASARARATLLGARRVRLEADRRRLSSRLGAARGRLQALSRRVSRGGRCSGLPGAVSSAAARTASVELPGRASHGNWARPVERYKLSAGFGGSGRRWARGHTGQDFAVPVGTPVRSVGRGRVISLTCGDGFGISMVVQHGAGVFSQYAHLSAVAVGPGQWVRPGQQIALSGTTGNSTGPHLHFEVRRTPNMGSGVDPVPWLGKRGVRL